MKITTDTLERFYYYEKHPLYAPIKNQIWELEGEKSFLKLDLSNLIERIQELEPKDKTKKALKAYIEQGAYFTEIGLKYNNRIHRLSLRIYALNDYLEDGDFLSTTNVTKSV